MLTVISFFTKDWKYHQYANDLERDCINLGIPYKIEELRSTGSYLKNTCLKPRFILDKLKELRSPVLWIDCDGSLLQWPIYFYQLEVDFAAKRMPFHKARTWHVGTMWFNYTPAVLSFIERWIRNTGLISDESGLEKTWREVQIRALDIPAEYFKIVRDGELPSKKDVICHRISNSLLKKIELPTAIRKAKRGIL